MILSHFSDTHGLPRKPVHDSAHVVAHSGDLFPNRTRGIRDIDTAYQENWLRLVVDDWKRWCGDRPLVFVAGNHDYFDPVPIMRRAGIDAHNAESVPTVLGVRFGGIPDVPNFGGEWNHERSEAFIGAHMEQILASKPDVLVNHCPIAGYLDVPYRLGSYSGSDTHIGSVGIREAVRASAWKPRAILFGHCHEQGGGSDVFEGISLSNAATTRRLVEIA